MTSLINVVVWLLWRKSGYWTEMLQKALTRHDLFVLLSFSEVFRTMLLKIYPYIRKKIPTLTYHVFFLNLNFYPKVATVVERLWMKPYGAVHILVHSDNMTFILDLFLTALISLTWWLVEIFPESVDACILQWPSFWTTLQNFFGVCGYSFFGFTKTLDIF